jgi:hypothetical protein
MEITPKFEYVDGSFNTEEVELVCVPSDHQGHVRLCIKEPGSSWNIPIGEILLYDSERYVDFKATLADATNLGKEIARRWNECNDKK